MWLAINNKGDELVCVLSCSFLTLPPQKMKQIGAIVVVVLVVFAGALANDLCMNKSTPVPYSVQKFLKIDPMQVCKISPAIGSLNSQMNILRLIRGSWISETTQCLA